MVLAGRTEFHIRPALFHQRQVDPDRGQVSQVTTAAHGQVFHRLVENSSSFFLSLHSIQRADHTVIGS